LAAAVVAAALAVAGALGAMVDSSRVRVTDAAHEANASARPAAATRLANIRPWCQDDLTGLSRLRSIGSCR
jgi:hypothetical protein